jgi:hypothetical protein
MDEYTRTLLQTIRPKDKLQHRLAQEDVSGNWTSDFHHQEQKNHRDNEQPHMIPG